MYSGFSENMLASRRASASGPATSPGALVRSGFLMKRPVSKTGGIGWKKRWIELRERGVSWHAAPMTPALNSFPLGPTVRVSRVDV